MRTETPRRWVDPVPVDVSPEVAAAVGGHPLVAQTLARRGLRDARSARAFLDPRSYSPASPYELPDLARAAERVVQAIRRGEAILVWGDFDVDGQTATTILVSTLRALGGNVRFHIPDREAESHGVNLLRLRPYIDDGIGLVLSCDTGITAHEAIAYVQARGVDVVVTDHHELTAGLPPAYAVANPKRLVPSHPLRELPGAGVAYKLAEALYERAGRPQEAEQYLDLLALAIVADVAVLTGDTRYLLQRGLEALRRTERLGLRALCELAELDPEWLNEGHIGYAIGPRLNALGRLANANVAVEFLTTADLTRARILATELEGLNAQRRLLTDQVAQAAEAQIDREPALLDESVLVLSHPAWPAGIVGIVAGRLAERYHRPAILIATPSGGVGRGSARSVPGCDISAALAAQRESLLGFGGHPMAAGLTIDPQRIGEFRRALSHTVRAVLGEVVEAPPLAVDFYVNLGEVSLEWVGELERLAPFGAGNPQVVLASRGLSLKGHSPVGRGGEHRQMVVEDESGDTCRVMWWDGAGLQVPEGRFDLAFTARTSDYRGQRQVQLEWMDVRPVAESAPRLRAQPIALRVIDLRGVPDARDRLERLCAEADPQVWAEAGARAQVAGRDRTELEPCPALAIWTTPPGPRERQAALVRAAPETVYLFAIDPGLDEVNRFLERLAGVVKRAMSAEAGRVKLVALAAATAQREATVRVGLKWLEARGFIQWRPEGDEVLLTQGDQRLAAGLPDAEAQLRAQLAETAAYRAHFAQAAADTLVVAPAADEGGGRAS